MKLYKQITQVVWMTHIKNRFFDWDGVVIIINYVYTNVLAPVTRKTTTQTMWKPKGEKNKTKKNLYEQ